MGKGDIKTKKGKITAKSFGVSRPRKPSNATNSKPVSKSNKKARKKSVSKSKK